VQQYFKYESIGKIAENISSGEEFSENIFRKGQKYLRLRPCKTTVVLAFEEFSVVAGIFLYLGSTVCRR